jgi:hypothetical protein
MTDWIALAEKHGAKFELTGTEWWASAYRKGRPVALFTIIRDTKQEAAKAFCEYIHVKEPKK